MRILFFVQGEGKGHLTQALAVYKILKEDGHTIPEIVIGKVRWRAIPPFFLKSADTSIGNYATPELYYGRDNRKLSVIKTILFNLNPLKIYSYWSSLRYIRYVIRSNKPDLIINFYEPLFGIYALIYKPAVKIVSIANQFMIFARGSSYGQGISGTQSIRFLSAICKMRSSLTLALAIYPWNSHREAFKVIPPVLREDVLKLKPYDGGYLLCYVLNAGFADDIIKWHNENQNVIIHVFRDDPQNSDIVIYNKNLYFHPIDGKEFLKYLEGCSGLLSTAGFEAICEAAFLEKPVLMTPAHLEQEINANEFARRDMGIISDELNPSLLINYIERKKGASKDNSGYKNRILGAEKALLDAVNSV